MEWCFSTADGNEHRAVPEPCLTRHDAGAQSGLFRHAIPLTEKDSSIRTGLTGGFHNHPRSLSVGGYRLPFIVFFAAAHEVEFGIAQG